MKNPQKILALLGGAQILAVMAGLPIDTNGFFLTAEQMEALDTAVEANELAAADLLAAKAEVTTVTEQLATANTQLTAVNQQLTTATARITELEAMDGNASGTNKDADDFDSSAKVDPMAFDFQQEILNRLNA